MPKQIRGNDRRRFYNAGRRQRYIEIANYLTVDSADTALRFEDEFWQTLEQLRGNPETGSSAFGIATSLRYARVSRRFRRYLIFYRLLEDGKHLQVVRVLQGARNKEPLLSEL